MSQTILTSLINDRGCFAARQFRYNMPNAVEMRKVKENIEMGDKKSNAKGVSPHLFDDPNWSVFRRGLARNCGGGKLITSQGGRFLYGFYFVVAPDVDKLNKFYWK